MTMTFQEIFLIAIALAADAFTVGLAVGIRHQSPRQIFRLSFHFGLFQALLPAVGAISVRLAASPVIDKYDHYIGAALLAIVGGKTLLESLKNEETKLPNDLTRGMTMVGLSLAVSIDALAVGFPLGFSKTPVLPAVLIIGITTSVLTVTAMKIASRVSRKLGSKTEFAAGLVLIGIGVKILLAG
jgi:manganese efflux pump family protein